MASLNNPGDRSSSQNNQNSGQGGGVFRDANTSLGGLDIGIDPAVSDFLNNLGASTSSATSGNIAIGDVYSGSSGSSFGLVKTLIFGGLVFGLLYFWRKK